MGEGGGVGFGVGRGGEEGKRWVGIEIGAALDSGGFFVVGDFVRGFGRGFGDGRREVAPLLCGKLLNHVFKQNKKVGT